MDDVFNSELTYTEDNALAESAETSYLKLLHVLTFVQQTFRPHVIINQTGFQMT